MYCPEADCIILDKSKHKAMVKIEICKGCELCVTVCTKQNAITMHPVDSNGKIDLRKAQEEAAGLGQAYAG
jgi:pyruvate ferredoxin oxidoreductase delta subunit